MLHTSRTIAAPPARAWDLVVDVRHWPSWGPSVRAVRGVDGRITAGTTGHVVPVVGPALPFEVTDLVDDGHLGGCWTWRVAGVPATTHEVRPHPGLLRHCVVTFGVPTLAAPYLSVCVLALRRIEQLALGDGGAAT